ncbi:Carbon monoxide dehydrogenase subunit G [Actinacidiphila yanglinensis]|uniref:Carbon monoxide dehydrogenase subunit G n=1 Tax=Actinacidiphila yanglinensis TaxID=310779 RepID=A0A1H6BRN4_9ACTN|nr:SRPBCC family protein [Actinacidiphila yanglinensis]SEG63358.1 Carbon monoxide dehydrogenase subunit G [Actinacidiphila yanglinensis]
MKIENEFGVDVSVPRAWEALTDLESLAPCMPGAQLTGVDGEVYKGRVKVKVGPVISRFTGSAHFEEKDDDARHAVVAAAGKDARGGGNASARIDVRLRPEKDGTRVSVSTDLTISGKLAQFGSGMIKEISEKLLAQFVDNLETQLHNGGPPKAAKSAARKSSAEPPVKPAPEAAAEKPAPKKPVAKSAAQKPAPKKPAAEKPEPGAAEPSPPAATPPTPARPAPAPPAAAPTSPASSAQPSAPRPEAPPPVAPVVPAATAVPSSFDGDDGDDEALDLMELAGPMLYKRLLPAAALLAGLALAVVVLRRVLR